MLLKNKRVENKIKIETTAENAVVPLYLDHSTYFDRG